MAFTYKIYTQGGMHVLGTLSDDTLIGERAFNPGRLEAQASLLKFNSINIVDSITDDIILDGVSNIDLLTEEKNIWGPAVNDSIIALNEFFQTAIYNITQIDGIPTPGSAGYLKWTGSAYEWAPITGSSPAGYITALQDDDSPVLGGNLTVNNHTIGINETVEVSNNLKLTSRTTPPTANAGGMYYNSSSDAFFVALES